MKNIKEILQAYLRVNGFDGFYNRDGECGCSVDDMMPCGECSGECAPGYLVETPGGEYDEIYCSAEYRAKLLANAAHSEGEEVQP